MKKSLLFRNRGGSFCKICLWVCLLLGVTSVNAQDVLSKKITLELKDAPIIEVLLEIQKQTDVNFAYGKTQLEQLKPVTLSVKQMPLEEVLKIVLKDTGFEYVIQQNTVVIKRKGAKTPEVAKITITGKVTDKDNIPLPGVTILLKGTTLGITTDMDGKYSLTIPGVENPVLVFSFIGMKKEEIAVDGRKVIDVVLQEEKTEVEEVVVTGIYNRKKESFTGSSQTYKAEELKVVGNQNLLQSLKTLDPAFAILENNQYGSDPNRLPDVEIRGKSSIVGFKEEFGEDPNQPLFILDGFESSLRTIMDLSMDRIASVTILKDAASTAIYGAKAANGVIVVETKVPEAGKIRLTYNGSFDVSFADLSAYNLMNAAEKLEFERLAGNFSSNVVTHEEELQMRYNRLLANVKKGVDTYWMSEPLRIGLNQRHNLYVQGGDQQIRFGLGLNYTNIEGVMKESRRQLVSGNLDLLYRVGKLNFQNKLTLDFTKTTDPIVPFSEYSRANPYYPKYNEFGGIDKWLETPGAGDTQASDGGIYVPNPLWNASLNSYNEGDTYDMRNNLDIEYRPWDFLYVRGRIGVSKSVSTTEVFRSPEDTQFDETESLKKGSYSDSHSESFGYDGSLTVTYGQLLADAHQINAVLGLSFSESTSDSKSFSAIGFPRGDYTTPGFANSYTENSKPGYSDAKKRAVNFYFNGGYSYMNRYLLDVNLRADGSSVFGSNKRFTTTWAIGLAWNLHNEDFIKNNTNLFSMLKIRASIGNPGNQNFGSFKTINTYKFNNWMQNNFGTGILVDAFGDPDLDWQKTLDKNIGADVSMFNNRFHVTFDYYHKLTDPLLASIGVAMSVGVTSRLANIGKQVDKGFNGTIKYSFIYKPKERVNLTTSLTFRRSKAYYDGIETKLGKYNNENIGKNLSRYFDGDSPTALWTVRSEGIDPATGKEIFLTKDGRRTFTYDYENEVLVGDTRPDLEGVFGNVLYFKGLSASIYFRYSFGADAFNSTLYNKVENISREGLQKNQDKRALYDRWKEPGDKARFKGIALTDVTQMSSRFVQKNNYIVLESVRLGYELPYNWIKKTGFSGMSLSAYMNDICRIASLKDERGIDYPFARSVTFAISVNF
ncbi:SusC/RagA family TonB-linked outer membrane protein [Butyricimonas hominis]|uniref:SusC/RagA family TonB-linked outer membrane protein n=1 Tax=Butyricimonas hominis TaxID=2763032 RepID=A0ABR7CY95_9BACT|nr:SusC/RagA family TonB-linked outer membrane protein [Butyricimonas hominis]MBC5620130.1 SusC/RagA family TonB-linked outer membrane protein [Butyricimonas hominis]